MLVGYPNPNRDTIKVAVAEIDENAPVPPVFPSDEEENEEDIEHHMIFCHEGFKNLIGHASEEDGLKRSAKACYIIKHFNPQNAKDMATVLVTQLNRREGYYPMFFEDRDLVNFCHVRAMEWADRYRTEYGGEEHIKKMEKRAQEEYEWYMRDCVGHIDAIDIHADVWKLSPIINAQYPSEERMFGGVNIGEGWHNFKKESMMEAERLRKRLGVEVHSQEL